MAMAIVTVVFLTEVLDVVVVASVEDVVEVDLPTFRVKSVLNMDTLPMFVTLGLI